MKINKNTIVWMLAVLLFIVILAIIVMCVCVYYPRNYPLKHIPVVNNLIDYYQHIEKKNNNILISLEQDPVLQTIIKEYCDRYNLDVLFQDINKYLNKYQLVSNTLTHTNYEYIIFLEKDILPIDFEKDIHRLISQAGDVDLIVSRDELYPNNVNIDFFIVRNNEFSKFKLTQLFSIDEDSIPLDVILDQIYTDYKPKSFYNFKMLDEGFPYLLSGICIYNGFAMSNPYSSYFLDVSTRDKTPIYNIFYSKNYLVPELLDIKLNSVYPWESIPGFIEISKNLENLPKEVYYKDSIPPYIFQTMETTLLPETMYRNSAQEWMRLNPLYTYFYFDGLDCRKFIKDNFDQRTYTAYDKLLPGAYKADFWRYCVLYKYGGVYVDSRTRPFVPLSDIIEKGDEFISPIDGSDFAFWQGVLMCKPEHPFLKQTISDMCELIEKDKYFSSSLELTGPERIGKSINKFLKRDETTSFKEGVEVIDGYRIKALMFYRTRPYITYNDKKLIITKFHEMEGSSYNLDNDKFNNLLSGKEHYGHANLNRRVYKKNTDKHNYIPSKKLLEIQDNLLILLKGFDSIAQEYNLEYSLTAGTLLGCIRHQSIIPWDDDIDLFIPQETRKRLYQLETIINEKGFKLGYEDDIYRFSFNDDRIGYIDLFEFIEDDDKLVDSHTRNRKRWPNMYYYKNEMYPLKLGKFNNDMLLPIPNEPYKFLNRMYNDWRVPKITHSHHNL